MEKLETYVSALIGAIGSIISALVGGIGVAPTLLIGVQLIDYTTGLMASKKTGVKLNSSIGFKGLLKKVYVLLLVLTVYMVEKTLFGTENMGSGVAIAYIANEFISITENGIKMGAPIPDVVKNAVDVLRGKDDKKWQ
jgi:toxin secretion/phage lysis holin